MTLLIVVAVCGVLAGLLVLRSRMAAASEAKAASGKYEARRAILKEGLRSGNAGVSLRDHAVSADAESAIGLSSDGRGIVLLAVAWTEQVYETRTDHIPDVSLTRLDPAKLVSCSVQTRTAAVVDKKGKVQGSMGLAVELVVHHDDLDAPVTAIAFLAQPDGEAEDFHTALAEARRWEGILRVVQHRAERAWRMGLAERAPAPDPTTPGPGRATTPGPGRATAPGGPGPSAAVAPKGPRARPQAARPVAVDPPSGEPARQSGPGARAGGRQPVVVTSSSPRAMPLEARQDSPGRTTDPARRATDPARPADPDDVDTLHVAPGDISEAERKARARAEAERVMKERGIVVPRH